jgi:hypothetical protein
MEFHRVEFQMNPELDSKMQTIEFAPHSGQTTLTAADLV